VGVKKVDPAAIAIVSAIICLSSLLPMPLLLFVLCVLVLLCIVKRASLCAIKSLLSDATMRGLQPGLGTRWEKLVFIKKTCGPKSLSCTTSFSRSFSIRETVRAHSLAKWKQLWTQRCRAALEFAEMYLKLAILLFLGMVVVLVARVNIISREPCNSEHGSVLRHENFPKQPNTFPMCLPWIQPNTKSNALEVC